ncbi:MAG TPA: Smr/MutS family protein, partial [Polyangia bacterium]
MVLRSLEASDSHGADDPPRATERACVPNDLLLGFGQTLVVSGPNAGGKTVALKTAGLAAVMARAGLHVAAQEGSRVPLFSAVLSDVGDDQSLERNLSTFSAHILHLREFLAAAQPGTLILLDEIAVGTDPTEGAALAQAVLEELAGRGATCIVTTHYDRLKVLAARDRRFVNASVGFDVESLKPTYELHLGVPGASGAIVVARRLGLGDAICARAKGLGDENQSGIEELLHTLEAERKKARRSREAAEAEHSVATSARLEAERRVAQAKERLEQARKAAHDEAVETLRSARAELDRTRSVLRRKGGQVTPAEMVQVRQTIDAAAQKVHESAPAPPPPPGRLATAEELVPPREVWVQRLGGRAQVLAPPRNGKVAVQAGPLKLTVPFAEVRLVDTPAAPSSARARRGHNAFDDAAPQPSGQSQTRGRLPSIDLRGERVDAALGMTEKFLDDAIRSGQDAVLMIHGHGTGALRDRLRAHLRELPFVSEVRPGEPDEGGDGVTVATLG